MGVDRRRLVSAAAGVLWPGLLSSGLLLWGCDRDTAAPPSQPPAGLWVRYTPFDWSHDGDPFQSAFFTVYSDAASDTLKRQVGEIADASWRALRDLFGVDSSWRPAYPPGATGLEIYVNREHEESVNWAYWGGFILTIRASNVAGPWYDYVVYTVRHELTHELEFLIEGREVLGADVWFREGIAVYAGCLESAAFRPIRSLSELDAWIAGNEDEPGGGNPIAIRRDSDYPAGADRHQYYRLFELAMRYLLDVRGWGRSTRDVRDVFVDLANGVPFPASFQARLGVSVASFESELFDRLGVYLGAEEGAAVFR